MVSQEKGDEKERENHMVGNEEVVRCKFYVSNNIHIYTQSMFSLLLLPFLILRIHKHLNRHKKECRHQNHPSLILYYDVIMTLLNQLTDHNSACNIFKCLKIV